MNDKTDWPTHVEAAMQLIRVCSETIPRDVQDRMREVLMASGEPVAWLSYNSASGIKWNYAGSLPDGTPLYAAPQVDAASVAITEQAQEKDGEESPIGKDIREDNERFARERRRHLANLPKKGSA